MGDIMRNYDMLRLENATTDLARIVHGDGWKFKIRCEWGEMIDGRAEIRTSQ